MNTNREKVLDAHLSRLLMEIPSSFCTVSIVDHSIVYLLFSYFGVV